MIRATEAWEQMDDLSEDQRFRLASLPVWVTLPASQVLLWRRQLIDEDRSTLAWLNRDLMVRLLMAQCTDQLAEIPLEEWHKHQVDLFAILPMAIDRLSSIFEAAKAGDRDQQAVAKELSRGIRAAIEEIDFLDKQSMDDLRACLC